MTTVSTHPSVTMLEQLGGNKFIAMTGAKDFMSADNPQPRLLFRLPRDATKGKGTHMEISLTPDDLYTLVFFRVRARERRFVEVRRGVFAEDLRRVFTEMTGLHTSLGEQFDRREMLTANGAG